MAASKTTAIGNEEGQIVREKWVGLTREMLAVKKLVL
jgi:hypothetical protein